MSCCSQRLEMMSVVFVSVAMEESYWWNNTTLWCTSSKCNYQSVECAKPAFVQTKPLRPLKSSSVLVLGSLSSTLFSSGSTWSQWCIITKASFSYTDTQNNCRLSCENRYDVLRRDAFSCIIINSFYLSNARASFHSDEFENWSKKLVERTTVSSSTRATSFVFTPTEYISDTELSRSLFVFSTFLLSEFCRSVCFLWSDLRISGSRYVNRYADFSVPFLRKMINYVDVCSPAARDNLYL